MAIKIPVTKKFEGRSYALILCWLFGSGCLLAWNSMLTVANYYAYLFPRYHPSRIPTIIYQSFAIGALSVLVYKEASLNTGRRNLFGYSLFSLGSLAILVLDLATWGRGGIGSFIGVCIISAVFGLADAHVLGGLIGDLSLMAPEFVQSFLAGLAASGALTSGLRLVTKVAFKNSRNGLRKEAIIVKFYRAQAVAQGSKTVAADLVAGGIQELPTRQAEEDPIISYHRFSNRVLFLLNIDYGISLFLVYLLTFSIFPGVLSKDSGKHSLGDWYPLMLIAVFNVSDLVGRYVPLVKKLKMELGIGLMITSLARFLLVPAFYYTARYGNQGWMIFLTSVLGSSNGYLTVCILTVAPMGYSAPERNGLGNILVLCLSGGMFAGVMCDWLWFIGKGW